MLDKTLIRTCRQGLYSGKASFGRSVCKTKWVYGYRVALSVCPKGVITAFGWPRPIAIPEGVLFVPPAVSASRPYFALRVPFTSM